PALVAKPVLLALNKIDLPNARESLVELQRQFPDIRGLSAATRDGVRDLVLAVSRAIEAAPLPEIVAPPAAHIELIPADAFAIERDSDGAFVVRGERIERLAAMTDFDSEEALARFEHALGKIGVEKKLRELGAREGDTVRIGEY